MWYLLDIANINKTSWNFDKIDVEEKNTYKTPN